MRTAWGKLCILLIYRHGIRIKGCIIKREALCSCDTPILPDLTLPL